MLNNMSVGGYILAVFGIKGRRKGIEGIMKKFSVSLLVTRNPKRATY